jgi:ketosteroid isomerase-like protein
MRLRLLALAGFLLACHPGTPAGTPTPADAGALSRELEAQFARSAADWNRGDLEGFLSDYARDSLTSFVSRGHLMRGFDWIRSHYAPGFAPGAQRDSLRFEEFVVRPLSPTLALVNARFILARDGRTTASGPFTLVMERQSDGWKILHDHTSSD